MAAHAFVNMLWDTSTYQQHGAVIVISKFVFFYSFYCNLFQGILREHVRRHYILKHKDIPPQIIELEPEPDYNERFDTLWKICFPHTDHIQARMTSQRARFHEVSSLTTFVIPIVHSWFVIFFLSYTYSKLFHEKKFYTVQNLFSGSFLW